MIRQFGNPESKWSGGIGQFGVNQWSSYPESERLGGIGIWNLPNLNWVIGPGLETPPNGRGKLGFGTCQISIG
jgi:hypothetical protein